MNRTLIPVALAVLVLLAGCIAPLQTGSTDAASDARTVSVSGTGEVTADADLAVVSVSVIATADTADAARQAVAADAESMRTALRDAGVPDDAVTTESFRIQPQYRNGNGGGENAAERTLTGYRAVHAFEIEVAPAEAGGVIDVAVANGADRVDGVRFTLTDETRADLRADAIAEAMNAARSDAEAVAAAEGLQLDGLRSASTSPDYVPYADMRYESAGGGGASTDLEPGPVTVTADVQVTYDVA